MSDNNDRLGKYVQRYEALKKPDSKDAKTAIKTDETVFSKEKLDEQYQTDLPTVKYAEYNKPDLSWLTDDLRLAVQQPENPIDVTKTIPTVTGEKEKRAFMEEKRLDEQVVSQQVRPMIESQKLKEQKVTKPITEDVLPDYLKEKQIADDIKLQNETFTQGLKELQPDSDTEEFINNEWRKYTIERERESLGNYRYLDSFLNGAFHSIASVYSWLPDDVLPKPIRDKIKENYEKSQASPLEGMVYNAGKTILDIYRGLGMASKLASPVISMIPATSPVGLRTLQSSLTLVLPTAFKESSELLRGKISASDYFNDIINTAAIGSVFGSNPFSNPTLGSLYTAIVPTAYQVATEQGDQLIKGEHPDWKTIGEETFYNTLFGIMHGYNHNKTVKEQKEWIRQQIENIEGGRTVDPEFKEMLRLINTNPTVKETVQEIDERYKAYTEGRKPKLKYLGEGIFRNIASEVPQKTGIPLYDEMLNNPEYYAKEKGMTFKITEMTPSEYLERTQKGQKITEEEMNAFIDTKHVEELKQDILINGLENMPTLTYSDKYGFTQEGRHRAIALRELGIKKVPVMEINEQKPTKEPILEGDLSKDLSKKETPLETPLNEKFQKISDLDTKADLESDIKTAEEMDIKAGDEVYTRTNMKVKITGIDGTIATVKDMESGREIRVGVTALNKEPRPQVEIDQENELRKMLRSEEPIEEQDSIEKTHGSVVRFLENTKQVVKQIFGKGKVITPEMIQANPVGRDFGRDKGLKFTGRQLEGHPDTWTDQIVNMMKVFRSGLVENNVIIGLDENGKIVGTMAISANHPQTVGMDLNHIDSIMFAGAKFIITGHNHPSGNVEPSAKDKMADATIKLHMKTNFPDAKVLGSYVINHKTYAWTNGDNIVGQHTIRTFQQPLVDLRGTPIFNIGDVEVSRGISSYIRSLKDKNVAGIVTYDASGYVRDFWIEPINDFVNINIVEKIKTSQKTKGGGLYTIVTPSEVGVSEFIALQTEGSLPIGTKNVVWLKENGHQVINLDYQRGKLKNSLIFYDMPFDIPTFESTTGLQLSDSKVFQKALDLLTDTKSRWFRAKDFATVAWNNIMIDMERYTTKRPEIRKIYEIIDQVLVRNMQYDYNYGKENVWKSGNNFRIKSRLKEGGLTKEEQNSVLSAFQDWHETNRVLQEHGYPLMAESEFLTKYPFNDAQLKAVQDVIAVKEHGIKMLKQLDVYKLLFKQTSNPLLEDYYTKRMVTNDATKKSQVETAYGEMMQILQDNQMADYVQYVMLNQGVRKPIDVLNALWNEPDVKNIMIQKLVEDKYQEFERQMYFPTSRLEGKYFVSATDKIGEEYFATFGRLSEVQKDIKRLQEKGYAIKNYDPSLDLAKQENNFRLDKILHQNKFLPSDITEAELHQLAVKSGIDLNNPALKEMLKTLNSTGFKRHLQQKRYVEGFKWTPEDFENAIDGYLWGVSVHKNRFIGKTLADKEIAESLKKGVNTEDITAITKFMEQFDDHTKDYGQSLRRATSLWFLVGKPSYYMQQMLQPLQGVLPYVTQKEFGKLGEGEKDFAKGFTKDLLVYQLYRFAKFTNKMTPEFKSKIEDILGKEVVEIMDSLKLEGVLSANTIKDILGVHSKIEHQYKGVFGKAWDQFTILTSAPSSFVETTPRMGTALTLLNTGRRMGLTGVDLKNFVATGVARTMGKAAPKMGIPNVTNRFGGGSIRTALRYPFVFKQFSAMNTALYGHLADNNFGLKKIFNRAMGYKLGVGMVQHGIRYAPFAGTLVGLVGIGSTLYKWIENQIVGGSGDGFDPDQIILNLERYLNNEIGGGAGTILTRGLLTQLTQVDFSKIFQEATVLPTETLEYQRSGVETIGGASVSFISSMVNAITYEDWKRTLPVALSNIIRALPEGVIQQIIESDKIPMTFKKSLVHGNISTSGVSLKGDILASPEELQTTGLGYDATDFARYMKLLGFTTLEITRIYENAKYIQERNKEFLDNIDIIEEENKSLDKQYQLKASDIIKKTKQRIGSELNKNADAYNFHSFGQYLDGIIADLEDSDDPMVKAYANNLKKDAYRKSIFKRSKLKPYQRMLEEERITPEKFKDTRTKLNKIIEEIK